MKSYRIAKCLINGEIGEYACIVTDEGKRIQSKVYWNEEYGKYFLVPNERPNDGCRRGIDMKYLIYDFKRLPKDAYDTIKAGNGDYTVSSSAAIPIFDEYGVAKLVDREKGDKLREQYLKETEDLEFYYIVQLVNKNSFSPSLVYLGKKHQTTIIQIDGPSKLRLFKSVEDAKSYIDRILELSKDLANKICESFNNGGTFTDVLKSEGIDDRFSDIRVTLAMDMIEDKDDKYTVRPYTDNLPNYRFNINQYSKFPETDIDMSVPED